MVAATDVASEATLLEELPAGALVGLELGPRVELPAVAPETDEGMRPPAVGAGLGGIAPLAITLLPIALLRVATSPVALLRVAASPVVLRASSCGGAGELKCPALLGECLVMPPTEARQEILSTRSSQDN